MVKLIIILILITPIVVFAQSSVSDDIKILDFKRNEVLLQDSSKFNNYSFFNRSTSILHNYNKPNSSKLKLKNLSLTYNFQNNDKLPYGSNDGNFLPSVGFQKRYDFGINTTWGILDINYQPEFVLSENIEQERFEGYQADGNWWTKYYFSIANNIDNFRYINIPQKQYYSIGQSRIGLNINNISTGISSENIWWGPAIRNSFIFTNNAPGFNHYYLQTKKPIKTPIGNFEFNVLTGSLETYNFKDPDDQTMRNIYDGAIEYKKNKIRILNALNINLQPKNLDNLFFGLAYSEQYYKGDSNENNTLITKYSDLPKYNIGAFYFRLVFPEEHAEFYAEVGQQNVLPLPWKFFSDTSKNGYIFGIKKLYPLSKTFYLDLNLEFSQLSLMDARQIFSNNNAFGRPLINSFYHSNVIRQGYTNQAQLLGASIGPGSNSQNLNISLNSGYNKLGFFAERVVHNNDFYHYVYITGLLGNSKADAYWVDLTWGFQLQISLFKKLILSSSFLNSQAMNYRWVKNGNEDAYALPGINSDKFNIQKNFSIKYIFNANR